MPKAIMLLNVSFNVQKTVLRNAVITTSHSQ